MPGPPGGGLSGHPRQLESGDDHDRSRVRRRHLRRAADHRDPRARSSSRRSPMLCCRPSAVRPALNLAMELVEAGVLEKHGVELIGADAEAIATAEDREKFKEAMIEIGLDVPASAAMPTTMEEARTIVERGRPPGRHPSRLHPRWRRGTGHRQRRWRSSRRRDRTAWRPAPSERSSSRSRSTAGRSSSSRSCATRRTTR